MQASCSWTVSGPKVAVFDAGPLTWSVMNNNLAGAPAVMVSCCAADVSPVAAAVMVGVPGISSP